VAREICAECPHGQEFETGVVPYLVRYLNLVEAGCPVGRHELTDEQWLMLGRIRGELKRLAMEDAKEQAKTTTTTREINIDGRQRKR
jgi:hypothetical protein